MRTEDTYLQSVLGGKATLLFDGAMGSLLQASGALAPGQNPDYLNIEAPSAITDIHRKYVEAGSQAVTANTFRANRLKLAGAVSVHDIYKAAYDCARAAGPRYIAAEIGPTGEMLEPYGDLEEAEALDIFAEQAHAIAGLDFDMVIIETMTDLNEALLAVRAVRDHCSLPILASLSFEAHGRTMFGADPASAAKALSEAGADCVGMNCSVGPADAAKIIEAMRSAVDIPLICQPNAGLPRLEEGETVYDMTAEEFCAAMEGVLGAGAVIIGGCCGTTPEFMRSLSGIL